MKKSNVIIIYVLCLTMMIWGCASKLKGPAFQAVTNQSEDKALIYLYWPDENLRTQFTIKANDAQIATLKNGGYFPYLAEPDSIDFSAKVNFKMFVTGALEAATASASHLKVNAEKGKVYFVKCTGLAPKFLSLSITRGQRLGMSLVEKELGESEIQSCKLLPDSKGDNSK